MSTNVIRLQEILNYEFKQPTLAELALSHGSLSAERKDLPAGGNQRLELVGDAVIALVLAETLYSQLPDAREGALATMRSELSRGEVLATCAQAIGLDQLLMVGSSEARHNPERTEAMLEDALEAVVGAVFLDGGYAAAATVVRSLLEKELSECTTEKARRNNPKGTLQELAQSHDPEKLPVYTIVAQEGPDHNKRYTVEVRLDGHMATGSGSSRKAAESAAAAAMLERLQ